MFHNSKNLVISGGEYHVHSGERYRGDEGFNSLCFEVMHEAFHDALARIYFPRCKGNTHSAPRKALEDWINAPMDCKSPILWLNGNPDTGISTVAQTIADQCSDAKVLLASFFFPGRHPNNTEAYSLFPTLAYQITTKIPSMRPFIGQAVEKDPLIFQRTLDVQMRELVMEPLLTAGCDLYSLPHLVVIDGLENCSMQREIILAIVDSLRRYNLPLMFLLSSHRTNSIMNTLSSCLQMEEPSYAHLVSNRPSFHDLTMLPHPSHSSLNIQTAPVMARAALSPTDSSPISQSPSTSRIPIVDHYLPTKQKPYKRPPLFLQNSSTITCIGQSPNGHTILVGLSDGTLRVWDTASGTLKSEYRCYPRDNMTVVDVAYSSSSYLKYLVILQDNHQFTTSICAIVKSKKNPIVVVAENQVPPLSHVHALSNGTVVAFCCLQGRVFLKSWKVSKHSVMTWDKGDISWDKGVTLSDLESFRDHSAEAFQGCAFLVSPKESIFWTATKTGSIFSSGIENGHRAADVLQLAHHGRRPSVSSAQTHTGYSRSTGWTNSASSGQSVRGFSVGPPQGNAGSRPATVIPVHATTSLPTQHPIAMLGMAPHVRLACSPDQRKLAVSFASGEILLWDITLRYAKIMRPARTTPASDSHRMPGASPVTFSTDGRYLVYACNDQEKYIKIQDIATTTMSDSIHLQECPDDHEINFISVLKDFKHILVSFRHCTHSLLFKWS